MMKIMMMMMMKKVRTGYRAHTASHVQGSWFVIPGVKLLELEAE
jgi:hypothetical protein